MGFVVRMKVFAAALALASAAETETKVIGGYTPDPHSQPYIVSLQRSGSHFCGGSLYAGNRAVSACHCTVYANFNVVAGAHNIKKSESTQQKKAVLGCDIPTTTQTPLSTTSPSSPSTAALLSMNTLFPTLFPTSSPPSGWMPALRSESAAGATPP